MLLLTEMYCSYVSFLVFLNFQFSSCNSSLDFPGPQFYLTKVFGQVLLMPNLAIDNEVYCYTLIFMSLWLYYSQWLFWLKFCMTLF